MENEIVLHSGLIAKVDLVAQGRSVAVNTPTSNDLFIMGFFSNVKLSKQD